ncbi:N-(5'-phosphoribosyl)anthranilate isomerase [Glutamicibacter uratoxydans]|uniref:N-(5'-phosphoribosyl)anthranilate isomerase n=1 Tax=Glutamicibacter uratoxydans TaxID=43667 RepID=A0A4Y4DQK8_GLUUR|nr:phosphoribosylanthranilate isomerase [Glutamicibacter uratoxydans]GED07226.1 N-(5'-phosphoribosyl)anthranilate isomerase [Glutamicibacter uratoxydans]
MSQKPFVKVCGLSTETDVAVSVEHGADAVGFVLTKSPREVSPQRAAELVAGVPETVATVAVFRSETVDQAIQLATEAKVGWIQLHGHRTPEDVKAVKAAGFHAIRAVRMDADHSEFEDWGEDFLLIDAAVPGSGESWDYKAVRELAAGRRWLVAGGLSAQNVAEALEESQATGADVSSGVESSRGVKDPELISGFLDASRAETPAV